MSKKKDLDEFGLNDLSKIERAAAGRINHTDAPRMLTPDSTLLKKLKKHRADVLSAAGVTPWGSHQAYTTGDRVVHGDRVYHCVSGGVSAEGPTGDHGPIKDGTVTWAAFATTKGSAGAMLSKKHPVLGALAGTVTEKFTKK